jgi:hypothetical protein
MRRIIECAAWGVRWEVDSPMPVSEFLDPFLPYGSGHTMDWTQDDMERLELVGKQSQIVEPGR